MDPIVKREASDGKTDLVMQAATGELTIGTECGMLHLDSAAVLEPQVRGSVQRFTWEIPLPNCFGVYFPQTAREMTLSEVLARRDELRERESTLEEDPTLDAAQVNEKRRALRGEIRWLDVELQKRPAVAIGCLCFALVGCAAGVYVGFGDILSAFVACFLPICATHHILLVAAFNGPPRGLAAGDHGLAGRRGRRAWCDAVAQGEHGR